ncbi:hypothetical protein Mapa_016445 [Marchantia paleacea]|nr:hypothetical protein Mapa_016445 [Marchantia paleacea]
MRPQIKPSVATTFVISFSCGSSRTTFQLSVSALYVLSLPHPSSITKNRLLTETQFPVHPLLRPGRILDHFLDAGQKTAPSFTNTPLPLTMYNLPSTFTAVMASPLNLEDSKAGRIAHESLSMSYTSVVLERLISHCCPEPLAT